MALKNGLPAIRAEWLWRWQERGSITTFPLFGTGVLIVANNNRPQITFHQEKKGQIVKVTIRYWLAEGIILVPRWDPIEEHSDPVADGDIKSLGIEALKQRGMFQRKMGGQIFILIYQHVDDICAAQRQQVYIQKAYTPELQEIEKALAEIEARALRYAFVEPDTESLRPLIDRKEQVYAILPHIKEREAATKALRSKILGTLKEAERALRVMFISEPFVRWLDMNADGLLERPSKELLDNVQQLLVGLKNRLVNLYFELNKIKVRPIVRSLKLAQLYLRASIGAIGVVKVEIFDRQIMLAIKKLEQAQKLVGTVPAH